MAGPPTLRHEATLFRTPIASFSSAELAGFGPVFVKRPALPDRDSQARFVHEVRLLESLRHRNLPVFAGAGADEQGPFVAHQWVDSTDFADVARICHSARVPIPMELSLYILGEVLEALDHVHGFAAGGRSWEIVHRNVAPDEVLVGRDGVVRLTDFSVASSVFAPRAPQGTLFGKPSYMSPEQARGEPADARSDLFAVGIQLYEFVTGLRPFRGADGAAVLQAVRLGTIVPPRERNRYLPVPLAAFLTRALEPDPGDRFQSAREMRDELRRVAADNFPQVAHETDLATFLRRLPAVPRHGGTSRTTH